MTKKGIALLLTICLLFTILPATAFAEASTTITIGGTSIGALSANQSGTGWSWSSADQTLTLDSAYVGGSITSDGDLSIMLDGSVSISIANATTPGVDVAGSLQISKTAAAFVGTLTLSGSVASAVNAVKAAGTVTVGAGANLVLGSISAPGAFTALKATAVALGSGSTFSIF